jgi:hypothetical protein
MIQEILTGVTVSAAFVYSIYSFWKTMSSNNHRACGGGCPSCRAKNLLIKDMHKCGKKNTISVILGHSDKH